MTTQDSLAQQPTASAGLAPPSGRTLGTRRPEGSGGVRIELERSGSRDGLLTIREGGGMINASIIERIS